MGGWGRHCDCLGSPSARKQGGAKPCKLDAHRDYLLALIDETPDLTVSECWSVWRRSVA